MIRTGCFITTDTTMSVFSTSLTERIGIGDSCGDMQHQQT